MSTEADDVTLDDIFARIGELIEQIEQTDPEVRDPVLELLDYVEAWHREGLTRLAMAMPPDALESARSDPLVAHLLDTYLAEEDVDPAALVEEALDDIRPYLHSHGGEMDLIDITDGVVTLRLMGSCDGCPSSMITLTQGVEQLLRERWPEFERIEVDSEEPADSGPKLLQIESLRRQ